MSKPVLILTLILLGLASKWAVASHADGKPGPVVIVAEDDDEKKKRGS